MLATAVSASGALCIQNEFSPRKVRTHLGGTTATSSSPDVVSGEALGAAAMDGTANCGRAATGACADMDRTCAVFQAECGCAPQSPDKFLGGDGRR